VKRIVQVLIVALILACFLPPTQAFGDDTIDELIDSLPGAMQESARAVRSGDFSAAMRELLQRVAVPVKTYFSDVVRSAATVFLVCTICAAVRNFSPESTRVVVTAGTAAIAAVNLGEMTSVLTMGRDCLAELSVFSKTLLPTLCAATVMSGSITGAGTMYTILLFVCDVLIDVITQIMAPLVWVYCALMTGHSVSGTDGLFKLAKLLRNGILWALKLIMGAFTGYLALSGILSGASNAVAVKTVKLASGAIPLVGGVLSDAAEMVVAGASAVKGIVGVVGIAGIISVAALPFIKLAVAYGIYKCAAVLSALTGAGEISGYAENLSEGFLLILAMCAVCCLMIVFGIFGAILGAAGI